MKEIINAIKNDEVKAKGESLLNDLIFAVGETIFSYAQSPNQTLNIIPIIKSMQTATSYIGVIRDEIFISKMAAFFSGLDGLTKKDRMELIAEFEKDKKEIVKRIIVAVERVESTEKAEILGKVFKSVLEKELEPVEYLRLQFVIDKVDFTIVKEVFPKLNEYNARKDYKSDFEFEMKCKQLMSLGLILEEIEISTYVGRTLSKYHYNMSSLGATLYEYVKAINQ